VPPFGDLADPVVVAGLAAEGEEAGWHGIFLWDHLHWRAPVRQVADPWITLAAAAAATERLQLGPMVTPLARRRPAKVARETVTLDWLSGGRLTLGVGLGSNRFGGELSATGEQLDDRRRGQMLDEALEILTAAWSGQRVYHHGEHYTLTGAHCEPRPSPIPPVMVGGSGEKFLLRVVARDDRPEHLLEQLRQGEPDERGIRHERLPVLVREIAQAYPGGECVEQRQLHSPVAEWGGVCGHSTLQPVAQATSFAT